MYPGAVERSLGFVAVQPRNGTITIPAGAPPGAAPGPARRSGRGHLPRPRPGPAAALRRPAGADPRRRHRPCSRQRLASWPPDAIRGGGPRAGRWLSWPRPPGKPGQMQGGAPRRGAPPRTVGHEVRLGGACSFSFPGPPGRCPVLIAVVRPAAPRGVRGGRPRVGRGGGPGGSAVGRGPARWPGRL